MPFRLACASENAVRFKASGNLVHAFAFEVFPVNPLDDAWHTAIGLQAVDGLRTPDYLAHTAVRNIEGEITFEEADALLRTYYEENPAKDAEDRTE